MGENYEQIFGVGLTAFLVLVLLYVIVSAATVALAIWVTYTIIWRSVRRGMREFYGLGPYRKGMAPPPLPGASNWR